MLPVAAPISRFRLTPLNFHSKKTIASPTSEPAAAFRLGRSPKGSRKKQVTATNTTKIRRTKIMSTEGPPRAHCRRTGTLDARAFFRTAPGGNRHFGMRGAQESGDERLRPVPAHRGLSREISK